MLLMGKNRRAGLGTFCNQCFLVGGVRKGFVRNLCIAETLMIGLGFASFFLLRRWTRCISTQLASLYPSSDSRKLRSMRSVSSWCVFRSGTSSMFSNLMFSLQNFLHGYYRNRFYNSQGSDIESPQLCQQPIW